MECGLYSFFLNKFSGDGYLTVSISLTRPRKNQLVLNIPFCLYLVDEHGHLKIYLPKKLLECLPKCTSLPKERHRWNTNEVRLYRPGSCTFCLCPCESGSSFRQASFCLRPRMSWTIIFAMCDQIISIDRAVEDWFCSRSFRFLARICCSFVMSISISYFQNFNHIYFLLLCKYQRKEQKYTCLSQTQTFLPP